MEKYWSKAGKENPTKDIKQAFHIGTREVISLVGMGGKTTALFTLGHRLKEEGSVLLSTTTKLGYPLRETKDLMFFESPSQFFDTLKSPCSDDSIGKGDLFLVAGNITPKKIVGLEEEALESLLPLFDYVVLEADGSRKYRLKAWRTYEPVIPPQTTMTIGIIPAEAIGRTVNESLVMNLPLFTEHYGPREVVDGQLLKDIILHPNGIFQYAKGKKSIFINGCEGTYLREKARDVALFLQRETGLSVVYGSLREGDYVY